MVLDLLVVRYLVFSMARERRVYIERREKEI
jgi:hypothetical protein